MRTIFLLIIFFFAYKLAKKTATAKPRYRKIIVVFVTCILIVLTVALFDDSTSNNTYSNNKKVTAEEITKKNTAQEEIEKAEVKEDPTEFEMEIFSTLKDKELIVEIDAKAIDGTIIEITPLSETKYDKFDTKYPEIKNGKGKCSFDLESWPEGTITVTALMSFSMEGRQQPDNVKAVYGEKGEYFKSKNKNPSYNFVFATPNKVAFPNEEAVRKLKDKEFTKKLNEFIKDYKGFIIDIYPSKEYDWKIIYVKMNDDWYLGQDYQKERFAEDTSLFIRNLVYNYKKESKEELIHVYFMDKYNKELAKPGLLGGYKIKR